MFDIKEFESIHKLLKKNNIIEAKKNLILLRDKYTLHPDYLFLMAEQLVLEDRVYQAIDALHSSLLIDYDDAFLQENNFYKSTEELIKNKFKILGKLFKDINNNELALGAKEANTEDKRYLFFKKLQKIMPGVGFKKSGNN